MKKILISLLLTVIMVFSCSQEMSDKLTTMPGHSNVPRDRKKLYLFYIIVNGTAGSKPIVAIASPSNPPTSTPSSFDPTDDIDIGDDENDGDDDDDKACKNKNKHHKKEHKNKKGCGHDDE